MKINIYHRGFLPETLENGMSMDSWFGVYLHGDAMAPEYLVDPPDIFCSNMPLSVVPDCKDRYSPYEVDIHINEEVKKGLLYLWSSGTVYHNGTGYTVENGHRRGLVVLLTSESDIKYAEEKFGSQIL